MEHIYNKSYYEFFAKYCLGYVIKKDYLSLLHTDDGKKGKVDTFPDFVSPIGNNFVLGLEVTRALSVEDGCNGALIAKDFGKGLTNEEICEDQSKHFKRSKVQIHHLNKINFTFEYVSYDKQANEVCKSIDKKLRILNCQDKHVKVLKRNELFIFAKCDFCEKYLSSFLEYQKNASYKIKFDTIFVKAEDILYILDCHTMEYKSIKIAENILSKIKSSAHSENSKKL